MTTTRINHTGHNHPSTTAARTACRKAMKTEAKVTMVPSATVGRGKALHIGVIDHSTGQLFGVRCGAGLTRNGSDSDYRSHGPADLDTVTCKSCRNKWGHAHG